MANGHHPGKGHQVKGTLMEKFWEVVYKLIFGIIVLVVVLSTLRVVWHYYHAWIILMAIVSSIIAVGLFRSRSRRKDRNTGNDGGGVHYHNHTHYH